MTLHTVGTVLLSVVMGTVFMLRNIIKPIMLSVILLSVIMLSVVMPTAVALMPET